MEARRVIKPSTPVAKLGRIIDRLDLVLAGMFPRKKDRQAQGLMIRNALGNLRNELATAPQTAKVLITVNDDLGHRLAVRAASTNMRVFVVNHRKDTSKPVEVLRCDKTATEQDFVEAVFDEAAFYLSEQRAKRLGEELSK